MGRKLRTLLLGLINSACLISPAFANPPAYTAAYIAKVLNWVPESFCCPQSNSSVCGGHFAQPKILIDDPNPLDPNHSPSQITASGPSTFATHGVSILRENVVMTQPGRIVEADTAYIYRNPKTGKIFHIHLVGHVRMSEFGKLIVADAADYYTDTRAWQFLHPLYHVTENTLHHIDLNKYHYDAWGVGDFAAKDEAGVIHLTHATYSTCSPLRPSWKISAGKMTLDHNEGRGYAYNVVLRAKNTPIFYFPYLNFPLDNQRHSGFLTPIIATSPTRGAELGLPYYWNMAPNYDMLITPKLMSKRGFWVSDWFRYLLPNSSGRIYASLNPDDFYFNHYIRNAIAQNQNTPTLAPYISALRGYYNQDFRGFINTENSFKISDAWSANVGLNYVTDDYYLRDYGTTFHDIYANQLQNEFRVSYDKNHWSGSIFLQYYQTLHLIDQFPSPSSQYQRLPEIDLNTNYPGIFHLFDYRSESQYVNFEFFSPFPPLYTYQMPIGQRYHGASTLSLPLLFAGGYFTPSLTNDATIYDAESATTAPTLSRVDIQRSRDLPIFNIDSGLYFDRDFSNGIYRQTFEPRLFYLYVPYLNQNNLPIFDTQLLPFTYDQLYATNRLSGFDRLENANQISLGALTRILSAQTGYEILNAGIGMEYYFQAPQVPILNALGQNVLPFKGRVSPLVGEITFYPNSNWSLTGNVAWDFANNALNNANTTLAYTSVNNRSFKFSYLFATNNLGVIPQNFGQNQISQLISLGASWPISHSVNLLGYEYYDITNNRQQSFFSGLEYSTCCWALRGVVSRNLYATNVVGTGPGTHVTNQYQTVYYLQFLLKGLGDFGNSDPAQLLQSALPGYVDPFKPK